MTKGLDLENLVLNVSDEELTTVKEILEREEVVQPSKTKDGVDFLRTLHKVTFLSYDGIKYCIMLKSAKMSKFVKLFQKSKKETGNCLVILPKKETEPEKRRYESRRFDIQKIPKQD